MNKLITTIIIGLIVCACSSDNSDCCTVIDIGMDIKYVNQAGENLFDIENGLDIEEIKVYYKIENEWELHYSYNLDSPKGISLIQRGEETYLRLTPSIDIVTDGYSETKIELSSEESDVIRTMIDNSQPNVIVTKVWYNNDLKWEAYEDERMFEVVK